MQIMFGIGRVVQLSRFFFHRACGLAIFAILVSIASLAQSPSWPFPTAPPKGDGSTDDTQAIQDALTTAGTECATVQLPCTPANQFKVSATLHVPKCVRFTGACGAVPNEGSEATIGTTLKWATAEPKPGKPVPTEASLNPPQPVPVVSFHDAPGATLSGISVDCENLTDTIGILYDSDNNPTASFLNVDNLMIKGCHQAFVVGLPSNTATPPSQCIQNENQPGCTQSDSFKFERYRILGNLSDLTGEGIHINSSNGAQSSLVFNGNIQGVNIGIHVISTNQGLIIENTDTGSPLGTNPAFIVIESSVADSPTLINNEVEGNTSAVIDHGNNPFGTPGNPVWLNNTWNNHQIIVDGVENITSIGNLLNQGKISNAKAHVLSINESGWSTVAPATKENFGFISSGAVFGASLEDQDIIMAENSVCPGFPLGHTAGDLVSCEGMHSGRLFLGGDLLLLNAGDDANQGTLGIQSGVYQDGSGLKHQTVSTGSVGPGGTVQRTLTWQTTFSDANYQAICSVADNSGFLQVVDTSVPTPSQVIAGVKNNDAASAHTGSVVCFAIHD
jgi:hypothetical protein